MAREVIDLTGLEPYGTRSRSRAGPIEIVDLTDEDEDEPAIEPMTTRRRASEVALGSFDEFLKYLREQEVTTGIGSRQLERLRELWDDGTLNDLSEADDTSDESLREVFFHSITVVKARDVVSVGHDVVLQDSC